MPVLHLIAGPHGAGKSALYDYLIAPRHPALPYTTHFHTAGYTFPYTNMHYVLEAGGNDFYEVY